MSKAKDKHIKKKEYKRELKLLQIELVKLQRHIIKKDLQILVIIEGRDAAGKDGVIKRITQHLSPREVRVVALGKPSNKDQQSWYFQRFVAHLPLRQEMVLMNRSWYNRAGVERVMNFCSDTEYEQFMEAAIPFEQILINDGIQVFKYYLDISKEEQEKRLEERKSSPLTQWKMSPIDKAAQTNWRKYSKARNEMFFRTHHKVSPWFIVQADNKKMARLNIISHLLGHIEFPDKDKSSFKYSSKMIFKFDKKHFKDGFIQP